jgi:hypothetical protein
MAIFVLALLCGVGVALVSRSQIEIKMSQSSLHLKEAFYIAEAGEEVGRTNLFNFNGTGDFSDDLQGPLGAAGPNGAIDFDPANITPVYDSFGDLTGFIGSGDDVPIAPFTHFATGSYIAFLTNDPAESATPLIDGNDRVMITAIGMGSNRSMEIVQAVIERDYLLPDEAPATITILGPSPTFDGGTSGDKLYSGNDCSDPNVSVPAVGVIGPESEALAETGMDKAWTFVSGGSTGLDTIEDVEGSVDPDWKDCQYWHDLALETKLAADVVGDSNTPTSQFGTPDNPKLVYIEGDYNVSGNFAGGGTLWVTGNLEWGGKVGWYGNVFVVGKGTFLRSGGGDGITTGPLILVNIAGPDGIMWTSDDCSGADGLSGTSDDGIDSGSYVNDGGGEHKTGYCLDAGKAGNPPKPYRITDFLQL